MCNTKHAVVQHRLLSQTIKCSVTCGLTSQQVGAAAPSTASPVSCTRLTCIALCILHFALCTLHFAFCTLHFAFCIVSCLQPSDSPLEDNTVLLTRSALCQFHLWCTIQYNQCPRVDDCSCVIYVPSSPLPPLSVFQLLKTLRSPLRSQPVTNAEIFCRSNGGKCLISARLRSVNYTQECLLFLENTYSHHPVLTPIFITFGINCDLWDALVQKGSPEI